MHYDLELNIGHAESVSYDGILEKGGLGLGMVESMDMESGEIELKCMQTWRTCGQSMERKKQGLWMEGEAGV